MFELVIIVICIVINAILAGSETAIIAVSRPTLRELVRQGNEKPRSFSLCVKIPNGLYLSFKLELHS